MDLIICFIDDSDFEHDLVRSEIAKAAPSLEFIQTYTFEECRDRLGERIPGLFLLDLWGKDEEIKNPYLTPKEELTEMISRISTLEYVYDGLEDHSGDRANEFLKRLFTIVDSWRRVFETVCDRIGQNRKYGLRNLSLARNFYPGVPAVFYTRKSLISDAVAMMMANTDGLFIKPTGRDDSETRRLTRKYARELIQELSLIIGSNIENLRRYKEFYLSERTAGEPDLEYLISGWKEFKNK